MEKLPIHETASVSPKPPGSGSPRKVDREKLKKACTDFEALVTARMLKSMRQTLPKTGFLGNDPGREVYQGLIDQELSRKISERGGLHLADMLYRQVTKGEEKSATGPASSPPASGWKIQSED